MKEQIYSINVSDVEKRIIIRALSDLREEQISNNKNHDFIDDLIVKTCDAPASKRKFYEAR